MGAVARRLSARLVGGASMFASLQPAGTIQMGERNVHAAREVLHRHGIQLVGEAVGGDFGRSVDFHLDTGRVIFQEMKEAARHGKMITELAHIYYAIKEGRGDLLITHDDYHQAVKMTGENSFEMVTDVTQSGVIDDITSDLAWEVISKKGRAIFTNSPEFKSIGNIALKVRY